MNSTKMDVERAIAMTGMAFDFDENIMKAVRVMAEACKDVTGPERCEAMFNIFTCSQNVAKKHKFPEDII